MGATIIGISAGAGADVGLMRQAGITHVRQGFPCPFADRVGGRIAEGYRAARHRAERLAAEAFGVMGVTPGIGHGVRRPGDDGALRLTWEPNVPAWMGQPGTEGFGERYRQVCAFLGEDLRGIVRTWQIANELGIPIFAGPLNGRQACELILDGAAGLKEGDPSLTVGTNTAGSAMAYYLYGRLHADEAGPLDYCGVDGYYGTWGSGGPDDWARRVPELAALTGCKVLVNEWGYSSAGERMADADRAAGCWPCQVKRWAFAWGVGHTPPVQAEYVARAFEAFAACRDELLGVFFYRWEDQPRCWQCGSPDCPAETAWGEVSNPVTSGLEPRLVDRDGLPKPAFHAFQAGAARLCG